jgi:hypothetical protein
MHQEKSGNPVQDTSRQCNLQNSASSLIQSTREKMTLKFRGENDEMKSRRICFLLFFHPDPGCQIFLGTTYQNGGKYAKSL